MFINELFFLNFHVDLTHLRPQNSRQRHELAAEDSLEKRASHGWEASVQTFRLAAPPRFPDLHKNTGCFPF